MLAAGQMGPYRRQKPAGPAAARYCSFCGKSQFDVRKLIAGPTVYICDECIDLCNDIIAEECDQEEELRAAARPIASVDASPWCLACRLQKPTAEITTVPGLGLVCRHCLDAISVAS